MLRILCTILTIILLALFNSPLAAEETTKQITSEAASGNDVSHVLPEITLTATKTDTPAEYSPFTTYTVDRKNIDSQPDYFRSNFGQLIQDVPGVFVCQSTYKPAPWINLRGTGDFNARTLYMVDGLPVGSSTMLTNGISNNDIERIDIVMGPSSALYGSNAAGGVVNIITRKGTKDMGATVSYGYGSNNTSRPHASVGNKLTIGNNEFNYYLSYSGDYSDGYRTTPISNARAIYSKSPSALTTATAKDAGYNSTFFSGKVGWTGTNGANLTLAYNYADLLVNGGQSNLIPVDDGKQGIGNLKFQLPISNLAKVTFTAGYQYWDRPAKTNMGLSLVGSGLKLDERMNLSQKSKVQRIPLELQNDFYFGENNILTAGLFYSKERITAESNTWSTGAFKSGSDYNTEQKAAYIQDQAFFLDKRLSILAGIRYDHWKYFDIYDSTSTPKYPANYADQTITYRGGAKYQFNDQFALRSSAGTAYYPGLPTWFFQNITSGSVWREANRNLKPEKTWMVDLGLEGKFVSTGTSFNVTAYYGNIKDMMSGAYYPHPTLPGVSIIRYSNVGKAEIYGVETQVNQPLADHLSAFVNLTFNHSVIVEDPVNKGNRVAFSPNFMGSTGVRYLNPDLVNANLTFRACSSTYYDNENTHLRYYHSDPFYSLDAKVWRDWRLTKNLKLKTAFGVENILDRKYAPVFVYENPGRTMQANVGINYTF
ncbi:MAG TPA: TonB-dependent receptor [Syntrophorhabdaceae bacterium]|nr:TonB-dependent receptor [Syntrophorhabdaceae bacterium]